MALFLRILEDKQKEPALFDVVATIRRGQSSKKAFECSAESFRELPGAPLSYWITEEARGAFRNLPSFESDGRIARQGLATADDSRFVRAWWETATEYQPNMVARVGVQTSDDFRFVRSWWEAKSGTLKWLPFAKGGSYSPIYGDVYLVVNWEDQGREIKNFVDPVSGRLMSRPQNTDFFHRPGLTWSLRTKSKLSMRVLPLGCAFSHKGPGAFCDGDDPDFLLAVLAVCSSPHFYSLVEVQLAAADAQLGGAAHSFEVGVIQRTPLPPISIQATAELSARVKRIWNLNRLVRASDETSRDFILPSMLLQRSSVGRMEGTQFEVRALQSEIDQMVANLYGFALIEPIQRVESDLPESSDPDDDAEDEDNFGPGDELSEMLSWAVGVAFGRFAVDPLAGERGQDAIRDRIPFEPLPTISPGMVALREEALWGVADILVDDAGRPNDLGRRVEDVFAHVHTPLANDVRAWLARDFFPLHLQRYSKSRRKAPIYWPLATASGGFSIWIYYPKLGAQTVYTAINDFVEPKLKQVGSDVTALREKRGARSRDEERQFETLQAFELGKV